MTFGAGEPGDDAYIVDWQAREIKRLKERNEKLEKVAKLAKGFSTCVAEFEPNHLDACSEYYDLLHDALEDLEKP